MAPITQNTSMTKRTATRKPVPQGPTDDPEKYFEKCRTKFLMGHTKTVRTVAWNCDGRKLASGSVDKTVRLWEADQEDIKYSVKLLGHEESVDQLCWNPKSPYELATASTDKSVRFWDTRDAKRCTHIVSTDGENINISWSWNGDMVAVGDKDDKISFIDPRQLPPVITKTYAEVDDIRDEINEISWNHDFSMFFLTTGSGAIKILEWPTLIPVQVLRGHTANCYCIDFDPKQRYVAAGGADATVTLWDIQNGVCLRTFKELQYPVRTISFTHDGVYLAAASEDEHIIVSNVQSGKTIFKIKTKAATNSVAWHPKGYLLAFAGDEETPIEKQYVGLKVFGFND
ncbi:WD40 repeat-like protein [Gigaspora margarita]|uniref:WD40 repeat-like protein n=1 Tax=Gigaspora margarita TaxID=4874 RepID=A0A8H3WZW4_GIGMA|nr:WD40 repeat-like protein [Gigaspora margarita]